MNDHSSDFSDLLRFEKQFGVLRDLINLDSVHSVLDFGCGKGDLLNCIANQTSIPLENLVGIDVAPISTPKEKLGFSFYESLGDLGDRKFDLIIISHTLEHLLDFEIMRQLLSMLTINGSVFVEVPNADSYADFIRKTPFYYFDRLHINHFTLKSLFELALNFEARVVNCRTYSFDYGDSNPYPALAVSIKLGINSLEKSLIEDYKRLALLKEKFVGRDLVIWGLGDNFSRIVSLGFFDSSNVVGLSDNAMIGEKSLNGITVKKIEDILHEFPLAVVILTMSWGREGLKSIIQEINPDQVIINL
jgi:SAM-dependent methyltransferase